MTLYLPGNIQDSSTMGSFFLKPSSMREKILSGNIDCPVDFVAINESQVRLTALQVFIFAVMYIVTGFWPLFALLVPDFLLRAANLGKYSLLNNISRVFVKLSGMGYKPADRAPKRFAAGIGFIFSIFITGFHLLQLGTTALALAMVILVFSFLESFMGFCAGCYVYSILKRLRVF
jgi:hypothetical protein